MLSVLSLAKGMRVNAVGFPIEMPIEKAWTFYITKCKVLKVGSTFLIRLYFNMFWDT